VWGLILIQPTIKISYLEKLMVTFAFVIAQQSAYQKKKEKFLIMSLGTLQ